MSDEMPDMDDVPISVTILMTRPPLDPDAPTPPVLDRVLERVAVRGVIVERYSTLYSDSFDACLDIVVFDT